MAARCLCRPSPKYKTDTAPIAVNHSLQFPSVTLSFNLAPGMALGDAVKRNDRHGAAHGNASDLHRQLRRNGAGLPRLPGEIALLIVTALAAVYIVLGILYESYIHPITILSTLPSAGVGAVLALMLFHLDLTIIALIGVILLIGIVKKNGILMVDFAIEAERQQQ